jgi:hypothetical protein
VTAEVDVVNAALGRIGATAITALTDGSNSANKANAIYAQLRDRLLRSHNWNFATKRVKLAQSSTTPTFEFDFAYPLPSDWIKNVSVHNNDAGHGTLFYRTEINADVRAILASAEEVWLRYVFRVEDPSLMAPDFRDAFEFALARDLAVPLASSNVLRREMADEYKTAIASARYTDGVGSFPELRPKGSWAASHRGRRRDNFVSE